MGAAIIIVSIVIVAFAEWLRRRGSHGMADDTGL